MVTIDLSAYKTLYLQTARDQVAVLQKTLALLQQNPQDKEAISNFHINAHSLKGKSLAMGFGQIGKVAQTLEFMFRDYKTSAATPSAALPKISEVLNSLSSALDTIDKTNVEPDLSKEVSSLTGC